MNTLHVLDLITLLEKEGFVAKEFNSVTKPTSRHWHISRRGERGTLEITWHTGHHRVEIEVRSNRQGSWTSGCLTRIQAIEVEA